MLMNGPFIAKFAMNGPFINIRPGSDQPYCFEQTDEPSR
jgi:hypothetical protein